MPCSDVTEVLALRLDESEHFLSYSLHKRTCGRSVGAGPLLEARIRGMPADAVLALDAGTWEFGDADEVQQFLELKHLFAVQSGLRALLGLEPAGADDAISTSRVAYDEEGLLLEAELAVDILTERIAACGRCKGCGSIAKMLATQ